MRLQRLEITGFKSFRDRVVLDFSEGISGVVGPNGCGKSNVVDAVRWVMGEQRVKSLRGRKMDDVIFNGSEDSAPVGLAEVTMVLADDGRCFPEPYDAMTEVSITRRLIRDGDSEYLINKVPCRLLDVREFFLGTGVGVRGYSLVEQGSVSSLVEARPEERRQFIEEAAGISKFKSRKESAIRKMETTRQNLTRMNDIIREVKTQLNAISRQAKRAEQYKAIRREVREGEIVQMLQAYADLTARSATLEAARDTAREKEEEIRAKLGVSEAGWEAAKTEAVAREGDLNRLQEALYELRNVISSKEQSVAFQRQQVEELTRQRERETEEIGQLSGRAEEFRREAAAAEALEQELSDEILKAEADLRDLQSALEEYRQQDRSAHRELEEKKVQFIELIKEKTTARNRLTALQKNREDLERREARDSRELEEQTRRREQLRETLAGLATGLTEDEGKLDDLIIRRGDASDELKRTRRELEETDELITEHKQELGRRSSRLQSLREFYEGYEWCGEGTRALLGGRQEKAPDGLPRESFLGLVADYIDVPRDYEAAVEAVLGEKLQYILVKNQFDGVKAIDYLKNGAFGRCSFVPVEVRNYADGGSATPVHLQETVRLLDVVRVRDDFQDVASCLLGDVRVISDLYRGVNLWRQNGFRGTFVTRDGDLISPHGVLTGGAASGGERSPLRNKREMTELEAEVQSLEDAVSEAMDRKREGTSLITQWEEELVRLRGEVHRMEIQINSRRKDLERYEDESRRIDQRLRVLGFERERLQAEEQELVRQMQEVQAEVVSWEAREKSMSDEMAGIQGRWDGIRADLEERESLLTNRKVGMAALQQRREANERTLERLNRSLDQTVRDLEARQAGIETAGRKLAEFAARIEEDKAALTASYGEMETLDADLGTRREIHRKQEEELRTLEEGMRVLKGQLEEAARETGNGDLACREIAFQVESLKQNLQARDQDEVARLLESFRPLEEEALRELQEKMERNRRTLDGFGEVNLLADEEYAQLKERFDFLTAQAEDLQKSLDILQQTITRINRISRQRFAETFEAVNACFRNVFSRLFPGGRGELRLTDETDMLETGVDIDIQVPGKRTQNITLLSGGEKSLAAIGLIFAIILHRPSPFVILDEVDAALDDANISLFNRLVQEIAASSQIILVTHNKRSMEIAGSLYGVTMQKQGISTVVSVTLQ